MAYETRNYNAFPTYPVVGPAVGYPITTFEGRVIRALLTGINFSARVQIANVINRKNQAATIFLPDESDWVTVAQVTADTPQPVDIAAPARWTRLVLDSGTLVMATIEEDTRAAAGTDAVLSALEDARAVKDELEADIAQTTAAVLDLGTQALEQAGSTPYPDNATMQAAKGQHRNGDFAYRLDNRTKYQLQGGEWVQVGEGAASAVSLAQTRAIAEAAQPRYSGDPVPVNGVDKYILAKSEGFPAEKYASQAFASLDIGPLPADVRPWAYHAQIYRPAGSVNAQDAVGLNARAISYGGNAGIWAGVMWAGWMRQQVNGILTLTPGSKIVTALAGSADWTQADEYHPDGSLKTGYKLYPGEGVYLTDSPSSTGAPKNANKFRTYHNAYIVASVDSPTQITLDRPWDGPATDAGRVYRTTNNTSSGGHTLELDIHNETGWEPASANEPPEHNGLSIAASGDTVSSYAIGVYAAFFGTPSHAPGFYTGLLFKDDAVRDSAIRFDNIAPRYGLYVSSTFAGTLTASLPEGQKGAFEFRLNNDQKAAYLRGFNQAIEIIMGPSGMRFINNANSAVRAEFSDNGDLVLHGGIVRIEGGGGATTLGTTGNRLTVNGHLVPEQSASVARLGGSATTAEIIAKINELMDKLGIV